MSGNKSFFGDTSADDEMLLKMANDWLALAKETVEEVQFVVSTMIAPARKKKKTYVFRDRENAESRLFEDYFAETPRWGPSVLRRHFRMWRDLFLRIVRTLEAREEYFQQRSDAIGRMGLSSLVKCTVTLRQLAIGGYADQYDEYLHITATTGLEALKNLCRAVILAFGAEYLRKPTFDDCQALLKMHDKKHGFFGILGSIDCMHWVWKNCPTMWRGSFTRGDKGHPTIMLEAVASQNLWIWHAFFGIVGSSNDINVLNQSPLFNDVLQGKAPAVSYFANGKRHNMADDAYPKWPTFAKTIPIPILDKRARFKAMQEATRKVVERAFDVLQARWAIMKGPPYLWYREHIHDIMYTCIILHKMIIKDEVEFATNWSEEGESSSSDDQASTGPDSRFRAYLVRFAELRDRPAHRGLQDDLIEKIWRYFDPLSRN